MSSSTVRVRFAPSPTGALHIGGVRTALFNWLFARRYGGTFLLRIEDTDKVRSTEAFLQAQLCALEWLGLSSDEPLVIQSENISRHIALLSELEQSGRCYEKDGALYFKVPREEESLSFHDLIRGPITVPLSTVDDFVVRRSDGTPIYNFCVVVDDHDMGITHVIRGEDHISNTIKQILLYHALSWQLPQFAHLPLIVNASGAPLSKRDGITDVALYRQQGFLPDALLNYLVRLGWAHGDQEIFSKSEMMQHFSLDGVGKKAAVFDGTKLSWVNQQHMMSMSLDDVIMHMHAIGLTDKFKTILGFPESQGRDYLALYVSRATTLCELASMVTSIAQRPQIREIEGHAQWLSNETGSLIQQFMHKSAVLTEWNKQTLLATAKSVVQEAGVGLALLGQPLRFAIVGTTSSPGIFDIMAIMGRAESIARLQSFEELLHASD